MDSNKNCGKSSAKSLKGFTLIELLIVIAILAILAGIISIITGGLVRDSRLEAARNTAQEVYTGIQNTLVQMEVKNEGDLLDPTEYGAGGTFTKYVTLSFVMDNGLMTSANDLVITDGSTLVTLSYDYPNAVSASTDTEKKFRKLAKYITDNLSMDFTGYVYAAIDMEDWVVDSVVYIEDYQKVQNSANGIADFVPMFKTKSSGSTDIMTASNGRVPFCQNIFAQKRIYSGKALDDGTFMSAATGTAVGYYPFLDDVSGTTVSYS